MMDLFVAPTSGVPLYQQLIQQLTAQIVNGTLPPGTPLPPIRTIAAELGVSIITVKRAWEELERDGLILTHVGRGTVVAPRTGIDPDQQKLSMAREQLAAPLAYCRSLGLTREQLHQLLEDLF